MNVDFMQKLTFLWVCSELCLRHTFREWNQPAGKDSLQVSGSACKSTKQSCKCSIILLSLNAVASGEKALFICCFPTGSSIYSFIKASHSFHSVFISIQSFISIEFNKRPFNALSAFGRCLKLPPVFSLSIPFNSQWN